MSIKKIPICTIGDLRKAIEGLDDDKLVMNQVVGQNSGAWALELYFVPDLPKVSFSLFTLEHRKLLNLPMDCNSTVNVWIEVTKPNDGHN